MGFLALIAALLLEQAQPLARDNPVHRGVRRASAWVARNTNAGEARHGALGWLLLVLPVCVAVLGLGWALAQVHPLAVFVLHVAVLYHTIGFRQFSHSFTEVQLALAAGDVDGARRVLEQWLRQTDPGIDTSNVPIGELCRSAAAHALLASHRHVFGPLFWYLLLPGAVGPVLYRLAEHLSRQWDGGAASPAPGVLVTGPQVAGPPVAGPQIAAQAAEPYGRFAQQAYRAIDWLPLRLTAAGFAVVGNFEDAVYCWRGANAVPSADRQRSVLLGAGSGALGLRLADPRLEAEWAASETGFDWSGAEPDAAGLRSAVGLAWRAVILWVAVFALLTVANWLG